VGGVGGVREYERLLVEQVCPKFEDLLSRGSAHFARVEGPAVLLI
jgi:hypothetical protein